MIPLLLAAAALATAAQDAPPGPVQVFVLAGQSNMQGKGFPEPVAWQVGQPDYRDRWTPYVEGGDHDAFVAAHAASVEADGRSPVYRWATRDDVWIDYLGRRGPLTVGYGTPERAFGPELGFGWVLGDRLDEPVLLVKCAWGGKSLGKDFLPPSAELPSDEALAEEARRRNERAAKRAADRGQDPPAPLDADDVRAEFGHYYRETVRHVRETLAELDERFPALAGRDVELRGFVWFQGWNDQFTPEWVADYERNLALLVSDLRRDLDAPGLRAVIGVVGFDGPRDPGKGRDGGVHPRIALQRAQTAVGDADPLAVAVPTAPYWDMEADAIFHGPGGWQEDVERWRRHGNDRPYHYLGSPLFFERAGRGFGEAMVRLLEDG